MNEGDKNMKIDARGKQCPLPVIETKKALETAEPGEIVCVLVDNEIAVQNLVKMANHKHLLSSSKKLGEREFEVEITLPGETEEAAGTQKDISEHGTSKETEECGCKPMSFQKKVVVISSEEMGSGDPVLGKLLMKGFIFALTQQDTIPKTILFYNGGAKWTCEGSAALEDLHVLEEQGAEILTCGTCLNHYGLSESLCIGGVTNMYEITEKMMGADLLVKP